MPLKRVFVAQGVFDTAVFVMTLIKALEHYKDGILQFQQSALLYTIYRDGILYYVVIVSE